MKQKAFPHDGIHFVSIGGMNAVNVNYIPSEWERTKKGIGDLIGLGAWGKGMIDNLKDISDLLEDVQSDIAKYDTDGVISFTHTDRKSQYQRLYEDYLVLHRFNSRIGEIVDRTIDEPFYQDIDVFMEAMRNLSISKIKTKNHIGAKKTVVPPGAYGTQQKIEVPKAEVGLEDLFSGSNYYARLMEREYASWKELNPQQDFSKQEYIQAALNSRAFQYESIKDGQMNKEFWGQVTALAVIVGTSLICPPAGMALGAAYGTLELSSAVSGKDWLSGRELKAGERVFRGVLSPLDIVPGVSALSKFSSAAKIAPLREALDSRLLTGLHQKSQRACDMVVRAEKIFSRIRNAKAWAKEIQQHLKNQTANGALKAGRFVDNALTNLKNTIPDRQMGFAMEGIGNVKAPVENTNGLEHKVRAYLSEKTGVNLGEGKTGNDGVELSTKGTGNGYKYCNKTTVYKNVKVYQRDDIIDPYMKDARGRTNLERMEKGLAPLGPDGKPINLHHMTQRNESSIAEVTQTFHKENSKIIHINPNTIPSGINRNEFDKWRKDYWKHRVSDFK